MSNKHPYPPGTVMLIIDPRNLYFNHEFSVSEVLIIGKDTISTTIPKGTMIYSTGFPMGQHLGHFRRRHAVPTYGCVPKYIPPEEKSKETDQMLPVEEGILA